MENLKQCNKKASAGYTSLLIIFIELKANEALMTHLIKLIKLRNHAF